MSHETSSNEKPIKLLQDKMVKITLGITIRFSYRVQETWE